MTDEEIRAVMGDKLPASVALAIGEKYGNEAYERVRSAMGLREGKKLSDAFLPTNRMLGPETKLGDVFLRYAESGKTLGKLGALMESLRLQEAATESLISPALTTDHIKIPQRPEIGLLEQLIEHQRATSEAAEASTRAQIEEAIEARRQARRTHRVTRAAAAAGILAGPLALYVSAADPVPKQWAISLGIVWVVAPVFAYFCDRSDPVLDELDKADD